ncbi:hypothetical protein DL546_008510 [Coniochaeta pulveracea]|uniref:FAD-binding domain-containing protein n=1 Tax=Coniochaeta pulveracea TaxID=177199 RepID=A0A420YEJ5_9PEZI|nr:hypothetical protein DL546_008510 [Coniochaeta pulveracea]
MSPSVTKPQAHNGEKREVHILIVGGGLTGLIFAQGLRKFNALAAAASCPVQFKYTIFERDPYVFARGGGYSLSFHWALKYLDEVLPPEVAAGLDNCLTNPHAVDQGDGGQYQYLNLRTGEPIVQYPISGTMVKRLSREKLIRLLMTDLDVQFSKQLSDITYQDDYNTVTAHFRDGSQATGDLLVGADGARSTVRKMLCGGEAAANTRLPIRMLGLRCVYPVDKICKCLEIDPFFYHGGDPVRNGYFWFSVIDLPRPDADKQVAECQMTMSWPYEQGFDGISEPADVPATNEERLAWMRRLADPWAEPMRTMVHDIPVDTEVREILLENWVPELGKWDNHGGRITLVGDAAHAMTIFRGEAANHGIVDVGNLLNLLTSIPSEGLNLKRVIDEYEREMIERTAPAVERAHTACIDANTFESVREGSSFLARKILK